MEESKYLDPYTDTGFKRVFGREETKELLIDFLNELFADKQDFDPVVDVAYLDKEKVEDEDKPKTIIYDVFCTCQNGRRFIVEMQQKAQPHFKERSVFYVSQAVCEQAIKGSSWNYAALPVYGVFFLNFKMPDLEPKVKVSISLRDDETGKLFSSLTRYEFIQLPYFKKKEDECESGFDKWIYVLNNLKDMDAIPFTREKKIFNKLKEVRDLSGMTPEERIKYRHELKAMRDLNAAFEYAIDEGHAKGHAEGHAEGRAEGRAEEKMEIALQLKSMGMDSDFIFQATGCRL